METYGSANGRLIEILNDLLTECKEAAIDLHDSYNAVRADTALIVHQLYAKINAADSLAETIEDTGQDWSEPDNALLTATVGTGYPLDLVSSLTAKAAALSRAIMIHERPENRQTFNSDDRLALAVSARIIADVIGEILTITNAGLENQSTAA